MRIPKHLREQAMHFAFELYNEGYADGQNDAWEAADKLYKLPDLDEEPGSGGYCEPPDEDDFYPVIPDRVPRRIRSRIERTEFERKRRA